MEFLRSNFVAIDFETANYQSDSACSIGVVRVEDQQIVDQKYFLIRPPYQNFAFTHIHGLTWADVSAAPDFSGVWDEIEPLFRGVEFIVAHNIGFDRRVLQACCIRYGIEMPSLKYGCTVQLARKTLGIRPANLASVCRALEIPLQHHNAMSDALACAKIVIAASQRAGNA